MAGKNRNTFEKMQREALKKRKAEDKRERRRAKKDGVPDEPKIARRPQPTDSTEDTAQ